jgi:UDP-2,3-diacylglucosamine pyrophosphatase LpxH
VRVLLTILFLIILFSLCKGQALYRMKMNVLEHEFHGDTFCTRDTAVIWGAKNDTICFLFTGKIRCFYTISDLTWAKERKRELKRYLKSKGYQKRDDSQQIFVLQDRYNEKYSIHFVIDKQTGGLIIFIANIDHGIPNYALATIDCDLCK